VLLPAQSRTLSGPQKVAVLLLQLGAERAAPVLRSMRESEIAEVMAEVARMRNIDVDMVNQVFDEFTELAEARQNVRSGGMEFARNMLEQSLGNQKADEILDRVNASMVQLPFEFLRKSDPRQILGFIQDEHPQTIALVLAYMHPEPAAMVMGGLSEERQREVAARLAQMDRTSPEVIEEVEAVLQRRLSSVMTSTELSAAGGIQALVDILNRSDRATERLILEGLEYQDEQLADDVRQRMFVFEDITTLDDRSIQLILRQVEGKELALALKGVRVDVRDKITKNMSQRAAQNLVEEIDMLGAVRIKHVEEAQGGVVRVIRALEESGQLVLSRSQDEFIE
jgi:flagellar motor switch protein FliG